jgi:hypothetical protein
VTREPENDLWGTRAGRLTERALNEIRGGADAIPYLSAALAALRIEAAELPASEMDGFVFPGEPSTVACICPPDLVERGGFRGGCPVHSSLYVEDCPQ